MSDITQTKIGGPCPKCGLDQIKRAEGCKLSRSECAYGKFGNKTPPKDDTSLAAALGTLAGSLARWEIAFKELDARVTALEQGKETAK